MSGLIARRWLVLCLAAVLLASAFVAGAGQAHASPPAESQLAMHHHQQAPSVYQHASPCGDQKPGAAHCCVSGSGCAVCAPLPAVGFVGASADSVFGAARPVVSMPGDDTLTLRPPKLSVTA